MNTTDRLTEELRRRAEGLPDQHPLCLADVQGRARGIRRRRYAATGLAAAAVLAVTVPLGIAAGERLDRTSTGPVDRPGESRSLNADPTPKPAPTPAPSPSEQSVPRRVALTTDLGSTGAAPQLPYLSEEGIILPDGAVVPTDGSYDALLVLGNGYVVGGDAGGGERYTTYLDPSGEEVWSEPSVGGPVLSPSGRLAAYGRADGSTLTVDAAGGRRALATTRPRGYEVAAVFANADSCTGVAPNGCTVYSNAQDRLQALSQTPGQAADGGAARDGEAVDDLVGHVEAVSGAHHLARSLSSDGTGGLCSGVDDADGRRLWDTCDRRLGAFSPDGRFLLGYPLEDGRGPRSVALLDARDGRVLREYAAEGRSDVFIHQAVWDTDGSVLATVWDTDHWSVLRMTVDGQLTSVPVEGLEAAADPDTPPVVLAGAP